MATSALAGSGLQRFSIFTDKRVAAVKLHSRHAAVGLHRRSVRAEAVSSPATIVVERAAPRDGRLFYDGIVFDMDGTLTEAHIDFADMRQRTRIPQGDLFTVLEASTPDHIKHAMDVILEIEAEAASRVSMKPGLLQLLSMLRERKARVALVTRNTTQSVSAFFDLIGSEWRDVFSLVLTREFPFVKPDKRLLLHVAQEWGVEPSNLLMVGDSFEDVEVGNAAGTATCMIAGGGNEKPGVVVSPPAGAVASFCVHSLNELQSRLEEGQGLQQGWPARAADGETVLSEGAPAPGLQFLDWCIESRAVKAGACSFPRMGEYAGGLATSSERGDKVLHLGCGLGGLTKMMASQGMQVLGVDSEVSAMHKRGLNAVQFTGQPLTYGSLRQARSLAPFDAILLHGESSLHGCPENMWWQPEALQEVMSVMHEDSRLCAEVPMSSSVNPAAIINTMHTMGLVVVAWQQVQPPGEQNKVLRLVARQA